MWLCCNMNMDARIKRNLQRFPTRHVPRHLREVIHGHSWLEPRDQLCYGTAVATIHSCRGVEMRFVVASRGHGLASTTDPCSSTSGRELEFRWNGQQTRSTAFSLRRHAGAQRRAPAPPFAFIGGALTDGAAW